MDRWRIELQPLRCKRSVLPLSLTALGVCDRNRTCMTQICSLFPSHSGHAYTILGTSEEIRTPKIWFLRPTRIPVPSPRQKNHGGCPRIRTANVYHEGPDLQSGDAHAIASRHPCMVPQGGNDPPSIAYQASALPLSYRGIGVDQRNRTFEVSRMRCHA